MKKDCKVLEIKGLFGLFVAFVMISSCIVGIIICPGWVCMHVWNFISESIYPLPQMCLVHGSLLWIICALTFYAFNINKLPISFSRTRAFNVKKIREDELMNMLKSINDQTLSQKSGLKHGENSEFGHDSTNRSEK